MSGEQKKYGYRGYYYTPGPRYEPDVFEGVQVIGCWWRSFQPPYFFGKRPKWSIETEHIAELVDGRYLVRVYGMSQFWRGPNSYPLDYTDIDGAIFDFERRIEFVNHEAYKDTWRGLARGIFFILLFLLFISYRFW